MTLGENLKRLRTEKGLSQEEVAGQLFLSRQTVSKWENNLAEPGVGNLKALAKLYGVSLDQLMEAESTGAPEDIPRQEEEPAPSPASWSRGDRDYLIWLVVLSLYTLGKAAFTAMAYNSVSIPFSLVAMVVGVWVRYPAMWVVMVCLFGVDLALGIAGLFIGSVFSGLGILLNGLYLWIMCRPPIRQRFRMMR